MAVEVFENRSCLMQRAESVRTYLGDTCGNSRRILASGLELYSRYFQVAGTLLLFLEEEEAFWILCTIIEDLLPPSYFATTLLGVQADQKVLRTLIGKSWPPSYFGVICRSPTSSQ